MNKLLILAALFYVSQVYAQDNHSIYWPWMQHSYKSDPFLYKNSLSLGVDSVSITKNGFEFLKTNCKGLVSASSSVNPVFYRETKFGRYITFRQTFNGIEVLGSELKINMNNDGLISSTFLTWVKQQTVLNDESIWTQAPNENSKKTYIFYNDTLMPAWRYQENTHLILVAKGLKLSFNLTSKKQGKNDTTVWLKVFNPDPLTTARANYGGAYSNFKDSNSTELNAQMRWEKTTAQYINDSFVLKSKYLELKYLDDEPQIDFFNDSLSFNRADWQFEYLMVYFHINAYKGYLNSLGYSSLANYAIKAWPHGLTSDDSYFQSNFNNPGKGHLKFGYCIDNCLENSFSTPCHIDDAEDADVIIHEYAHAIAQSANGNLNKSSDRRWLEEGICDFLACSNSNKISTFGSEKVFNWDGNNGDWQGRLCHSKYTMNDFDSLIQHEKGQIYASAFSDMATFMSGDELNYTLFETMYGLSERMRFEHLALIFLSAEERIYKAENAQNVCRVFADYKLVSDSFCVNATKQILNDEIFYINEALFRESGNLNIEFQDNFSGQLILYEVSGKLIHQESINNQLQYSTNLNVGSGVFVIVINDEKSIYSKKVFR
jgi:hypothetical protein